MDDSDDYYFGDDITFDEQTLAVLDQQEQKWQAEQESKKKAQVSQVSQQEVRPQQTRHPSTGQRRPVPQDAPLPPQKKQKTSHVPASGAHLGRAPVGEDDDDLPDISILGDGSYKFPEAQRATASELAAQMHGPPANTGNAAAAPSSRAHPPLPVRAPVSSRASVPTVTSAPASSRAPRQAVRANASSPAVASVPTQSQRLPSTVRSKDSRDATLNAIQAALTGFVPPAGSQRIGAQNVNPAYNSRASRVAPVVGLSRVYPNGTQSRAPVGPSSANRHRYPIPAPSPAPAPTHSAPPASRGARGASPSFAPAAGRRQSVAGPSRHRAETPLPQQQPLRPPQRQVQQQAPPQQPQYVPPSSQGRSDRTLQIEVDLLRLQVEELLRAGQEKARALEEAQNVRYAKEGEVSILRKSIEKTAKDHAAEVARIKAAREQAEAQQVQMRKELKEEVERLRTQYLFKQHEIETSTRKTPWSVRIKRTEGPLTPVSATQRHQYTSNDANGATFHTPSRMRNARDLPDSPPRRHQKRIMSIPDSPPRKPAKLRGFINAFEDSPPKSTVRFAPSQSSQSPTKGKGKGKEKVGATHMYSEPEREELFFNPPKDDEDHREFLQNSSPPLPEVQDEVQDDIPVPDTEDETQPSSSAEPPAESSSEDADVEMKDESKPVEPPLEPLLEPDWPKELQRIIFTHKHHSDKQLTLQLLTNFSATNLASPDLEVEQYNTLLANLVQTLGEVTMRILDPNETIRTIGDTLSRIGLILCGEGSVLHLTSLLDVMKVIALSVPAFVFSTLTPSGKPGSGDAPPDILSLLSETVRELLIPSEDGLSESQGQLATEVLGLLEAIAWHTPPELVIRLSAFVRKEGVLLALTDPHQPLWFLQRALRVLAVIASYRPLHKHFLLFPLSEKTQERSARDYTSIPHIEQVSALLIDPERAGPECQSMKNSLLHFISTLALAHRDSLNLLLESNTFLPSIIVFLMDISNPLWEEHEEFVAAPDLVNWTVDTLVRIVLLLFHVFTGADHSVINLRHKLMAVPKRNTFSGLWHMFTVALGRLSYAPPPEVSLDNQMKLEQISDLARDVLELVVDGPELEAIWAAFHIDEAEPTVKARQGAGGGDEDDGGMLQSDIE